MGNIDNLLVAVDCGCSHGDTSIVWVLDIGEVAIILFMS